MEEQTQTEKLLQPFLQKLQDELAKIIGTTVAVCKVVNKEGQICFRLLGLPKACQMVMATEKGMAGCNASCESCNALVKEKEEALLVQCHIGFLGFYFPIFIEGQKLGAVTGCAGLIPEKMIEAELKDKYQSIAENYGIKDKEEFTEEVLKNTKTVAKEDMDRNLSLLKNVVEEVIGVYETELKMALS